MTSNARPVKNNLTVLQLAEQLRQSGWTDNRKLLILAARFYYGLEDVDTLIYANLSPSDINYIVYMR